MSMLERETGRCGYFRPIARTDKSDKSALDPGINLIHSIFSLDESDPSRMFALSDDEVAELITTGRYSEMIEEILSAYKQYEAQRDFVLIEGTNYEGVTSAFEFDVNADIARALGAPVLLVVSGLERTEDEIYQNIIISKGLFEEPGCVLLGVIVNRLEKEKAGAIATSLENRLRGSGVPFAGAIPEEVILAKPRMDEIMHALKAEVLYGEDYLDNLVRDFHIASMQMPALLDRGLVPVGRLGVREEPRTHATNQPSSVPPHAPEFVDPPEVVPAGRSPGGRSNGPRLVAVGPGAEERRVRGGAGLGGRPGETLPRDQRARA